VHAEPAETRKGKGDGQTQAKETVDGSRVRSKPARRWRARSCRDQTQAQAEEAQVLDRSLFNCVVLCQACHCDRAAQLYPIASSAHMEVGAHIS
jgi:hypothetical protein